MSKKAPDKECRLAGIHIKPSQTIASVDKAALEEIFVSRQQGRLLQPQQETRFAASLQRPARHDPSSTRVKPQKVGSAGPWPNHAPGRRRRPIKEIIA